ncbi:MAG: endolytic transglycosylase MltG [Spirochaetota bacterium]
MSSSSNKTPTSANNSREDHKQESAEASNAQTRNAKPKQSRRSSPRIWLNAVFSSFSSRKKRKRRRLPKKERTSLYRLVGGFVLFLTAGCILSYVLYQAREPSIEEQTSPVLSAEEGQEDPRALLLRDWLSEQPDRQQRFLKIAGGSSIAEISQQIEASGVLVGGTARQLTSYLQTQGFDRRVKAGTYILPQHLTVDEAAHMLVRGYAQQAVLSLYEGITIEQIDKHLFAVGLIDEKGLFKRAATQQAADAGLPFAEGFLFPGQYVVPAGENTARLLARGMIAECLNVLDLMKRDIEQADSSIGHIITIASMIQRETTSTSQMPLISGVIWNRLREGMPLGIDATTRYETRNWSGPITAQQLRSDTPFNTRRRPGLPPTGIGSPGIAAIASAVYPPEISSYYYLHDASGTIHLADDYEEHLENIETYLH